MKKQLSTLLLSLCAVAAAAQELPYKVPPQAIADLVEAPATPRVSFSPNGQWMLLLDEPPLPGLAEMAQPELRLAGLRLNPLTNGPSRLRYSKTMIIKSLSKGIELLVQGLPRGARLSEVSWSPDNTKIAFTNTTDKHVELWLVDVAGASARLVPNLFLNGAFGDAYEWNPDSQSLLARAVVGGRGAAPTGDSPTANPEQDAATHPAARSPQQDLLQSADDERLFDYYATAQVVRVGLNGRMQPVGQPGVIETADPSPDGQYVLVKTRRRPYSHVLPLSSFPAQVDILDAEGLLVKTLAELPPVDHAPPSPDAVPPGPRQHGWRADVPATLYWAEAQDGGDPQQPAAVRDKLLTLAAPFDGPAQELAALPLRFRRMLWGTATLALAEGYHWRDQQETTWLLNPAAHATPKVLFSHSAQDIYHDPGTPFRQRNTAGRLVLVTDAKDETLYLIGKGSSLAGDQPFVEELNVPSGKTTRWWQSAAPYYEMPVTLLNPSKREFVTRRESVLEAPNYFLRNAHKDRLTALTSFSNPYAALGPALEKQVLHYKRPDGVALTANLYLPPRYRKEAGPLPTLLDVYPRQPEDPDSTRQVSGSPYAFTRLEWGSPLFWLTQGYAVLQGVGLPVAADTSQAGSVADVAQLVASAKATLAEGRRLGVVDTQHVAVVGYAYGAFLAANLLTHSTLFETGIARNETYNRPPAPFGRPATPRPRWQVPQAYQALLPFNATEASKIPLLLIHNGTEGDADAFAQQSERFYRALKNHGGDVRDVALPAEANGYATRESVLHMLGEMNTWLETYVKPPAAPLSEAVGSTAPAADK